MLHRRHPTRRRGVAAVEMALVSLFFLVPTLIGIWEIGRMIQVQQIVSNSAREGARLAAQAVTINTSGSPTQIKVSSSTPSVQSAVFQYLYAAGLTNLTQADVTVTFTFLTARTTDYVPTVPPDAVGTSYPAGTKPPDPCYGEKGQVFQVYVSIPWNKVRWTTLGIIQPTNVTFTVTWQMLTDDQFTVNQTIPIW